MVYPRAIEQFSAAPRPYRVGELYRRNGLCRGAIVGLTADDSTTRPTALWP